jgi:hypothetical protein
VGSRTKSSKSCSVLLSSQFPEHTKKSTILMLDTIEIIFSCYHICEIFYRVFSIAINSVPPLSIITLKINKKGKPREDLRIIKSKLKIRGRPSILLRLLLRKVYKRKNH